MFKKKIDERTRTLKCTFHYLRPITLNLPIGNEIKESLCGVNRAYHIGSFGNRTLLQTKITIQNDPPIPFQFDKVIRVGCIVNNYNDKYDQTDITSQFQYNDSL